MHITASDLESTHGDLKRTSSMSFEEIMEEMHKIQICSYILLGITCTLTFITICLTLKLFCETIKEGKGSRVIRVRKAPEPVKTERIYEPYPRHSSIAVRNSKVESKRDFGDLKRGSNVFEKKSMKNEKFHADNLNYDLKRDSEIQYEEVQLTSDCRYDSLNHMGAAGPRVNHYL